MILRENFRKNHREEKELQYNSPATRIKEFRGCVQAEIKIRIGVTKSENVLIN